jgi:hypothetical protein
MITYYSIDPTTREKTKIATFELGNDGVVRVHLVDPTDAPFYSFKQVVVHGRNGRPQAFRPEDGQLFLDAVMEQNETRTWALVVDE